MIMRTGKALAQEQAWRVQTRERMASRSVARALASRVPIRDRTGLWLAVCVALSMAFAVLQHAV